MIQLQNVYSYTQEGAVKNLTPCGDFSQLMLVIFIHRHTHLCKVYNSNFISSVFPEQMRKVEYIPSLTDIRVSQDKLHGSNM